MRDAAYVLGALSAAARRSTKTALPTALAVRRVAAWRGGVARWRCCWCWFGLCAQGCPASVARVSCSASSSRAQDLDRHRHGCSSCRCGVRSSCRVCSPPLVPGLRRVLLRSMQALCKIGPSANVLGELSLMEVTKEGPDPPRKRVGDPPQAPGRSKSEPHSCKDLQVSPKTSTRPAHESETHPRVRR